MDTVTENTLSIRRLGNKVRRLKLAPNSVLLVRSDSMLTKDNNINNLLTAIKETGLENIVVVVVDDLYEIETIDESTMNKRGWFRIEHLRKIVSKASGDKNV